MITGFTVVLAEVLSDGSGLVVLQDAAIYGADNCLILNSSGEPRKRINNPYRFHTDYRPGDQCQFFGIRQSGDLLILEIQVILPAVISGQAAMPIYTASYAGKDLSLVKMEWQPWPK